MAAELGSDLVLAVGRIGGPSLVIKRYQVVVLVPLLFVVFLQCCRLTGLLCDQRVQTSGVVETRPEGVLWW